MRFTLATLAFYAAVVLGQTNSTTSTSGPNNAISIPAGQASISVVAGSNTIEWTNPSSGTVTIQLQYSGTNQVADSGVILVSGVQASAGTATFDVPADLVEAGVTYTFRITDEQDTSDTNYAPAFTVSGATGTSSLPSGGSSTASGSSTTGSSTATSTGTDSTTTTDSSSTSGSSSASKTASKTSSSASAAATTAAPSSGRAGSLQAQAGGALAAAALAAAFL